MPAVTALQPPASCADQQPLPRPARPLRRGRPTWPRAGARRWSSGWTRAATLVLNADDPRVAALAPSTPGAAIYFGVDDPGRRSPRCQHAADATALPASAAAACDYSAVLLTATSATTAARAAASPGPRPTSRRAASRLDGGRPRPCARLHAGRPHRAAPAAARPLQRLQRAARAGVAARRSACAAGAIAAAGRLQRRLRAHRAGPRSTGGPPAPGAGQEPGRLQRGPAHALLLATGATGAPLLIIDQRPARRRARRLLALGRRLRGAGGRGRPR